MDTALSMPPMLTRTYKHAQRKALILCRILRGAQNICLPDWEAPSASANIRPSSEDPIPLESFDQPKTTGHQ